MAADFIRAQLDALPFDQICLDLLDATLKGFSVSELIYRYDGQYIVADHIRSLDQRRFIFDSDWKPRLWEDIMDTLNQSGVVPDALQMIDSTVVRAHHQAAGAKGGLRDRVLAVLAVASRPKSTSASTPTACQ